MNLVSEPVQGYEVKRVKGNPKNVGYKPSRWENNSSNRRYRQIIMRRAPGRLNLLSVCLWAQVMIPGSWDPVSAAAPSPYPSPFSYSLSCALLPHLPSLKLLTRICLYFPSASYWLLFKAKPIPIVCVAYVSNQDRPRTGMTFSVPPGNDLICILCSKYFCDNKTIVIDFWGNDHNASP